MATENLEEKIITRRKEGQTVAELLETLPVSRSDVIAVLRDHPEVDAEFQKRHFAKLAGVSYEEAERTVLSEYSAKKNNGMYAKEIAAKHGYPYKLVEMILFENHVSPSGRHAQKKISSTAQRDTEIIRMRKERRSYYEIARELSLSVCTVKKVSQKAGLGGRTNEYVFTKSQRKQIVKEYRKCRSSAVVAERIGLPIGAARKVLREEGILLSDAQRDARDAELYQNFLCGSSIDDLVEKFDLRQRSVYRIIDKQHKKQKTGQKPVEGNS